MGPASPAQTFIFPVREASELEVHRTHYPGGQPGRAGKWGGLGAGGGDPASPALGPEDKMLCLILSVAPKDGVIFLSWQAREGEFRKVKWAGQGHAVSVCQK